MSMIDNLLDGVDVEWKSLENIATITIGEFVRKDKQDNSADYPVYNGGISPTGFYDKFNNTGNKIIVSARGANAGFVNRITTPYWAGNSCYSIGVKDEDNLDWVFVYYFLKANENKLIASQQKVGIPAVSKKQIQAFQIPIPCPANPEKSLKIQKKIVHVLDTFTGLAKELNTELNTELNARKKQYEYYREQLLTFEDSEVEWKTLGEVFNTKNGYTPSKRNKEYWSNGTVPWFRMEDIRENGRILDKSIQKVNKKAVKSGKLFPANSIIIATSATIGEHALITVPYLSNQRFTNLNLKDEYKNKFNIKFLFYYSFLLSEWCNNNTTKSSFASVDMNGFKKFKIPIPPLAEQQRIVNILDKFDVLTTSISEGLPKEIELRTKQYEYYRNKLLTFPE